MLCFYLFTFAVVSLSTADYRGGERLQAGCNQPKKFSEEKSREFVKKINDHRRLMVEGKQRNGKTGNNLPTGENVAEMSDVGVKATKIVMDVVVHHLISRKLTNMKVRIFLSIPIHFQVQEWSCDLETKAIAALSTTCTESPDAPNGTTGLFYQSIGPERDPVDYWLSEMNETSMELSPQAEAPVKYHGKNQNYCNLVRYDASQIGCAEMKCAEKTSTFCLLDVPPLRNNDVMYYWGRGACPAGSCRPPTYGCNTVTGLCFKPVPTTTTTTTRRPLYCFGIYGCY
ncbi:hypothetical protein Y032_0030g2206 [Ancylostoma ceylanicum]|uniref:SCP domain-containing protein n=1 Tax=Ancylostoma ceylanicum TaxID=53326 RepID=A0A016US82_9BILA|nr:hypothetical protein Y032_0030g2206 [Ancylostoma ceylanicum]